MIRGEQEQKGICIHSNLAHNIKELFHSVPYQPGGVGVIITYNIAPRVIETGKYSIKLGIWTWTRLQGKYYVVTLLSAYRPYTLSIVGIQTAYEQHTRALPLN